MKLLSAVLAAAAVACAAAAGPRDDWQRVGRSHPRAAVEFTVSMPNSNLDKLDDAFWKISTPGNPMYGKHMSFDEIDALTATPAHTREAVAKWLGGWAKCVKQTSTGFQCVARVGDVEKVLDTKMYKFLHDATGRLVHKVDAEYTFPAEMEGKIDFISGLNSMPMPHYAEVRQLSTSSSGSSGSGGNGGGASTLSVVPSTIKSLYNLQGASASGVVQSAFEFQDLTAYTNSDLSTFISNTGVPSFDIQKHFGSFQQNPPQGESTLDVQYLGTTGAGATNYYYTSGGWMYTMTQDLLSNNAYGIDVVSMSYGWSEADQCQISPGSAPCASGGSQAYVQAVNTNFQKLGAAGVTLLAASGDAGAHGRSDLSCSSGTTHPGFPASSPYITAVGATQLASDAQAGGSAPICQNLLQCAISGTEIVSSTSTGALITSGGGFSNFASRPSYQDAAVSAYLSQSGVTPPQGDFNAGGRGYPDVAALGHNYYIELDGEVQSVDGTSAACPVFAGVASLLSAHVKSNGGSKLGFLNPLLYQAYAHDSSSFNDVVTGNNKCTQDGSPCCSTGFSAASGWDATTGLGTPNFPKLAAAVDAVTQTDASADALAELIEALQKLLPKHS